MEHLENETVERGARQLENVGEGGEIMRDAFSRFPSGVAALCAQIDGQPVGLAASSFTVGVSFVPPMVMFSVHHNSNTWPMLREAESIGISVLGSEHAQICRQLALKTGDRFAGLDTNTTHSGAVLIEGSAVWFETSTVSETSAGDHYVVVLQVNAVSTSPEVDPLVYHQSGFRALLPGA